MSIKRLSDSFMLVQLTAKQPKVTAKSEKARQAAINKMVRDGMSPEVAQRAAKAQIDLWPDGELRDVMRPKHSFDTYHRRVTIPYLRGGKGMPMLLSVKKHEQHSQRYFESRLAFQQGMAQFVSRYADTYERLQLEFGDWFEPDNYPHPDRVADSFGFKVTYLPVADPAAFELGAFTEEQADQLEKQLQREVDRAANQATREYRDRISDALSNLSAKLSGGKGTRLHGALVDNLKEILTAELNVAGNAALDQLIAESDAAVKAIERAVETREDVDKNAAADKANELNQKLKMLF